MKQFQEMLQKATSSPTHDKMLRFTAPLKHQFGINNFWYYKITRSGHYSYLGTHTKWNDYCVENQLVEPFTSMRHPDTQQSGINLMKNTSHEGFKNLLKTAWEKFGINFSLNIIQKNSESVEGFGFATEHNHHMTDEMLLNELPLLRTFAKVFKEECKSLFNIIEDNPVDLGAFLGPLFKEGPNRLQLSGKRENFLKILGYDISIKFTAREKDILRFIFSGYPASYIAQQLYLSKRTVENYIATIKCKLSCESKAELIQKVQDLFEIGHLEE